MNNVVLIGNLVADPQIREIPGENPLKTASYTLAVSRAYKREGQPEADFIRCSAFGRRAEFVEKYLKKGTRIAVTGHIQTGSYEKDGVRHYTTDVIVDAHEFVAPKNSGSAGSAPDSEPENGFVPAGVDEELPFN
jgi:single-strand DNA-binding protein